MNWSEFFSMGGYAFYVWGSYITTLLVLGGEVVLLMKRQKALRNRAAKGARQNSVSIMKRRHKRIALIVAGLVALGTAAGLVLSAFQNNLVFFFSPSQVAA